MGYLYGYLIISCDCKIRTNLTCLNLSKIVSIFNLVGPLHNELQHNAPLFSNPFYNFKPIENVLLLFIFKRVTLRIHKTIIVQFKKMP